VDGVTFSKLVIEKQLINRVKIMKMFNLTRTHPKQQGFTLIEILVSMGVLALGALALAGLQIALTQSAGNAKSRTTAVNIAQAELERLRGIASVGVNANGDSFDDIEAILANDAIISTVGGTTYTMTRAVANHYWVANAFTETDPTPPEPPLPPTSPDFKKIAVTVSWTDPSGSEQNVTLTDAISSLSTGSGGRTIAGTDYAAANIVPYNPGARPEVASIDLEGGRFKETLTPEPEIFSNEVDRQFAMTGFEVITFSQYAGDVEGSFLRREENRVLNCECTLNAADADVETFQPMVWTGVEYIEGSRISKPYGTPADGRVQDPLCDTCCQDHHDSAVPLITDVEDYTDADNLGDNLPDWARFKYDPWAFSPVAEGSVHAHYGKNDDGDLVSASTDDNYFEACRLIRSDGFFRVARISI
jgi:prepilin-type N-terminal cleavage/methylation domain-containing protein